MGSVDGDEVINTRSKSKKESTMKKFSATPEQAAIISFASDPNGGHGFVEAGAGSGKTTTALEMVKGMRGRILMVAFNKSIERELSARAPAHLTVKTMHALGLQAIKAAYGRGVQIDGDRVWSLLKTKASPGAIRENMAFYQGVKKLISLAKGALAHTFEAIDRLADEFGLDLNGRQAEAVNLAVSIISTQISDKKVAVVDFDDMIWLPVAHDLTMPKFDALVIDEAQDTNACQLEMLLRCGDEGARVIAVGDRRQAIYAFRGADKRAVLNIIDRLDAKVFPMMTTFRCGKAIVREAQAIVPDFRAGESNPEGLVREIGISRVLSEVRPGDMVISRTNAPLVSLCMAALAAGIRANITGRDVGASLVSFIKKLRAASIADLYTKLDAWVEKEIARLSAKIPVSESAIEATLDRADTVRVFAEGSESPADLVNKIETMFSDDDESAIVTFTSCHRAKGRERDRVFLLRDTFARTRYTREGEPIPPSEEEWNLLYVGVTRAKNELVYVRGDVQKRR